MLTVLAFIKLKTIKLLISLTIDKWISERKEIGKILYFTNTIIENVIGVKIQIENKLNNISNMKKIFIVHLLLYVLICWKLEYSNLFHWVIRIFFRRPIKYILLYCTTLDYHMSCFKTIDIMKSSLFYTIQIIFYWFRLFYTYPVV